ncbi:MAG: biliverdin-producing heme oxygenase [Gammaproteobacteria bacterium]
MKAPTTHDPQDADPVASQASGEITRSQRLKAATHGAHDALDRRIMGANPFASPEHYARFLQVQYRFHRDIDTLYRNAELARIVPDLAARRRLTRIVDDLSDLGMTVTDDTFAPALTGDIDCATALGWLYVAEGSNLGAAILFKLAAKLGLNEHYGARHLAGHPEGRARHWREFTAALDGLRFVAVEEERTIAGAKAAFERVRSHVEREYGG